MKGPKQRRINSKIENGRTFSFAVFLDIDLCFKNLNPAFRPFGRPSTIIRLSSQKDATSIMT